MSFKVLLLPAAFQDADEAAQWYESQQPGLGQTFMTEIDQAIQSLAGDPFRLRVRLRRKGVRWIYPKRFPYRICYYVDADAVRVFAIIHAARHDRHWKQRL